MAGRKEDGTVTTADAVTLCITAQCNNGVYRMASAFTSASLRLAVRTGIEQDL